MIAEVSSLAPLPGEIQADHYQRVYPLTSGTTDERNAAVLDAWDQSEEARELDAIAGRKLPAEKFQRVRRVPVFIEHPTPRKNWDRDSLAAMAYAMNNRICDTGSFSPLTDGHTPDREAKAAGAKPPKVLGYQGNFRLGLIGNKKPKWAIFADEYHHAPDAEYLSRLTRRSPEVWVAAEQPFFDPCAALGAETPRLDMGTISYSRDGYWIDAGTDGAEVEKYSMSTASFPSAGTTTPVGDRKERYQGDNDGDEGGDVADQVAAAIESLPVFQFLKNELMPMLPTLQAMALEYELPSNEPEEASEQTEGEGENAPAELDATATPEQTQPEPESAPALDDADKEMFAKYLAGQISEPDLRSYRDQKAKAAEQPAAPAGNAEEAKKYQLLAEVADLQRKKDQLAADLTEKAAKSREAERYSRLEALRNQGYEFEMADEFSLTQGYSDDQFNTHCEKVIAKYSRLPVGNEHFPVMDGDGLPQGGFAAFQESQRVMTEAVKYAASEAAAGRQITYAQAVEAIKAKSTESTSVK